MCSGQKKGSAQSGGPFNCQISNQSFSVLRICNLHYWKNHVLCATHKKGKTKKQIHSPLGDVVIKFALDNAKQRANRDKFDKRLQQLAARVAELDKSGSLKEETLKKYKLNIVQWRDGLRNFRDAITELKKIVAASGGEKLLHDCSAYKQVIVYTRIESKSRAAGGREYVDYTCLDM